MNLITRAVLMTALFAASAFAAPITVQAAEHPTSFALHVKNVSGADVKVSSTFSTYYPQVCGPGTGPYGDVLGNDKARTFQCNTHPVNPATWAQLLTIMSADRNHILCNVQILTQSNHLSTQGGVGPRCHATDEGTSIAILVR